MAGVHKSKEQKFRDSLNSWGDDIETRPFIRVKESFERDNFDYARKHKKIHNEKLEVSLVTGDDLNNIHIWTTRGLESRIGPITKTIII